MRSSSEFLGVTTLAKAEADSANGCQQRLSGRPSPATAASFVVFDALTVAGQDLRGLPYRKRRKQLRRLLADAAPPLALMPATRELVGAQAWMHNHIEAGVEGVIVKHREHGYRPQRRCWWKVRSVGFDGVAGSVRRNLRW